MSRFWVDVDNPPQAQYLTPIASELRARGHDVLLTARDHAPTLQVLENRGETPLPVGGSFGAPRAAKAWGTLARAARLRLLVSRHCGRPRGVVSTSRSGVLAARALGAPAFTVLDYEGVELGVFRKSGTTLLHPSVIPAHRFDERGFPKERLRSFPGLKEDIAFAGIDRDAVAPAELPPPRNPELPAVLVRPPSETSHYRTQESMRVLGLVLDRLADAIDVQVVLAPREPAQVELVRGRPWAVPPVILGRALPAMPLLRAVTAVVTGGGTMLREAAWLGVPAFSTFQGPMPAVDEWLESRRAVRRLQGAEDVASADWSRGCADPLPRRPEALARVVDLVLSGSETARR